MTVAVTGGTGFVGQAVLDAAERRGAAIRALARRDQAQRTHVEWIGGDLSDEAALAQLMASARAVIHIAGVVNAPDEAGFRAGNVDGTQNVVNAAREAGVQRFIHVSSLAAREPSLSMYGHSKRLAEEVVQVSDLDWTIVRPPAVYGPRDTEMFELFRAARWRIMPVPPRGRTSIIHVDDLARLLLDLVDTGAPARQRIFEPDDNTPQGWLHDALATQIGKAMGKDVWAPAMPRSALYFAARMDRALRGARAKLTPDRASYMAHPDWVSDPSQKVPEQVWSPAITAEKGLADTAAWYRDAGWL